MESTNIDFSNKQLLKLICPLVIEQILSIAVGLADSIMVAQVGDAAVSGVSLVDSISVLMTFVFAALAAGGTAVCGQYIGRQAYEDSRNAGKHLYILMAMIAVFITLMLYLFNGPIISGLFGKIDVDVMAATRKYYMYVMASIPALAIYHAGAALFRAMAKTDTTLKISFVMNGINVAGNAILIFGFGCGVEGVAIPTLVSWWVAAAVSTILLMNRKHLLHINDISHFKYNKQILKNIVSLGIPGGIENGMFQLGKLVLFSFISTMGTISITANAVGGAIANLNVTLGMAVNYAMTTVVSRCVGAGEYDKARGYLKKLVLWTYAADVIWITFLLLITPTLLNVYGVAPEAAALAYKIELLHGICTAVNWIPAFMVCTFLRSAGDATFTMIVSAASMWIGRVLGAYILGRYFNMGVMGVWIAHTIFDWIIRTIIFWCRYKSNVWTTKAIKS